MGYAGILDESTRSFRYRPASGQCDRRDTRRRRAPLLTVPPVPRCFRHWGLAASPTRQANAVRTNSSQVGFFAQEPLTTTIAPDSSNGDSKLTTQIGDH